MSTNITVPVFPESVTEGTILTWHKQPGESVARGELLAEVETDKVVFEVPAPVDGVLTEITMPAGTTVKSGEVVGRLDKSATMTETVPGRERNLSESGDCHARRETINGRTRTGCAPAVRQWQGRACTQGRRTKAARHDNFA